MSRPIHITFSIESHLRALLHIKSLFIGVLVHIAIHKLLHLDGVDLTTPRNLGHALLHDLLVAALGNLLTAVEWVQNCLNLLDDALLPLELWLLVIISFGARWRYLRCFHIPWL